MKLGEAVYKSQQKPNDDDKSSGGPKELINLMKKITLLMQILKT